jgi:alpha-beta hydrolase superfamily lysophospholipase
MKWFIKKMLKWSTLLALLFVGGVWSYFAFTAWRAAPLQAWHTFVPSEMTASALGAASWQEYIVHENQVFKEVYDHVIRTLPESEKTPMNRYYENSLVYPPRLAHDWNRSYVLYPEGKPKGAVVLLHGLTDTPYSLRSIANLYVQKGFVAFGIRLPGHGTVPAALTDIRWQDWSAATLLAMREAAQATAPDKPLHIVGFSNGGALAVKYVLDTLEDSTLPRVDQVVLLSPMIGITRYAKFVGFVAVPAYFPAFANAAWLNVLPEFNPFKYNSFPVNGARQSYLLCTFLQRQIERLSTTEAFATLPPVLTFQSVLDYTVSAPAVLYYFYAFLPENGSELVLFDVNRASLFKWLLRDKALTSLQRMTPKTPQRYTLSAIQNRTHGNPMTMLATKKAGEQETSYIDLDYIYPQTVFSLSHGAIPFPEEYSLYGTSPAPEEAYRYGVTLGNLVIRGERGALLVPLDAMLRMSSNPFFPFMLDKIAQGIADPRSPVSAPRILSHAPRDPGAEQEMYKDFFDERNIEGSDGASIF